MTSKRACPARAVALATLVLCGCFEDPVEDTLTLSFSASGAVLLELETVFHETERAKKNRAFAARLAEEKELRTQGIHPWNRWFDYLIDPEENGESFERDEGRLTRHRLWARARNAETALRRFFVDSPIDVALIVVEGGEEESDRYELSILGNGSRATRNERRQVERALAEWATAVAAYYRGTIELWRYIEANPARAEACLAVLFEDLVDTEDDPPELFDSEQHLLDRIDQRSDAVLELFALPEGRAFTLQELSRRVYDPFPARFVIELPVPASEVEGLTVSANQPSEAMAARFEVPRRSLWSAFEALEGRWLSPDPLGIKVRALSGEEVSLGAPPKNASGEPFDGSATVPGTEREIPLAELVSQNFSYDQPPLVSAVEEALLGSLHGDDYYRLSWRIEAGVVSEGP